MAADDPNDDPANLHSQVLPLLQKMHIQNMIKPEKTKLILGKQSGKNSLYCVLFKVGAQISATEIDNIKRAEKNLAYIQAADKVTRSMEIYLWWPYESPAELRTGPRPGLPAAPGAGAPAN